jgi:hypothetical protein
MIAMETHRVMDNNIAHDLRRASLKWLERFFLLLFMTLTLWYLFRWWALISGIFAMVILVRSINTSRMANLLDKHQSGPDISKQTLGANSR